MRTLVLVLLVAGCLTAVASADPLFCAVGWYGEFTHIDATVGQVPPTHADLPRYMQGLAWSPDGTLYAGAGFRNTNLNRIYSLNPWTGSVGFVCNLALSGGPTVRGLAISQENEVYITAGGPTLNDPFYLHRVDLDTGALFDSTLLTGEHPHAQGLAFSPDGTLFGIGPDPYSGGGTHTLLTIDPDGETHVVGQYEGTVSVAQSIAFTPDGRLFAASAAGSGPNFSELDPTDGSPIGQAYTVSGDLRGLEFIPEPVMLPVLAVFALGLRRKRR